MILTTVVHSVHFTLVAVAELASSIIWNTKGSSNIVFNRTVFNSELLSLGVMTDKHTKLGPVFIINKVSILSKNN